MTTTIGAVPRQSDRRQDELSGDLPVPLISDAAATGAVAVVGLGYVGLPTALSLMDAGKSVVGYDISEDRLAAIKTGKVDLPEEDRSFLAARIGSERFILTTDAGQLGAVESVIICVPTPVDPQFVPDLTALRLACDEVVRRAVAGQTIVLTSTTYVGCTDDLLVDPLVARGFDVGTDVFVAFSPERIDPGVADHSPRETPRVVGGVTAECARRATALLQRTAPAVHGVSSPRAAELTKLLENTFRAVNIALANEFSDLTSGFGVDPMEVISAAATKPYGFMPFYPGPGVGGHCIPCDPHYLLWQSRRQRRTSPVTEAAMWSIAGRPRTVVQKVRDLLGDNAKAVGGARVLLVGVAYKPSVADVRESPALEIIAELQEAGAEVHYFDPLVESVRTPRGPLMSHTSPDTAEWDLVIAHTLQPGYDYSWLNSAPAVLDTTYRLHDVKNRKIL
ncbi:nucleotide sugar dehydrogenase [Pseudonocardia sp. RS11V-5]|uniref:nucleotide sugar dehydrogenase n=1 Tax=Pseudonocardia terrae TaxID=2905831 RepID=UPI001E58543F|nr:nucleotide sugar dehydrogenase [Pseudonocardia terrae]MCE3553493.1 nucleotide sugar dehydrogenase [Pseudonocardia terrae]